MQTDLPACSAVLWYTEHINRKALHSSLTEFSPRIIITIHMVSAMARKACLWIHPAVTVLAVWIQVSQINYAKRVFAQLLANEAHLGLLFLPFVLRGWCCLNSLRQMWLTFQPTFEDRYWMTFKCYPCCHVHIRRGLMLKTHLLTYRGNTYTTMVSEAGQHHWYFDILAEFPLLLIYKLY